MNFHPRDDDAPMELPEEIVYHILSFLDAATLIQKKPVCRLWQELCTTAINLKAPIPRTAFETDGEQLRAALKKYTIFKAADTEEFAATYGWPMDKWDVFRVEDLSYLFHCNHEFNENIGSWNVSNATRMYYMFGNAHCFNQDISSWDTSKVTNMTGMFYKGRAFNQDLSSWNVSNVTNMSWMFDGAGSFNQDISSWDVSKVISMHSMFQCASSFDQDISSWDTSKVDYMESMFCGASSFTHDLSSWDISNAVPYMSRQDISFLKKNAKRRKLRASTESQRRLYP
eukprot:scaffold49463_cov47-Attheya_sp.AAC.4